MQLVFWQNIPSIHQAPFLKALDALCREKFGTSLVIVCEGDVPERRKKMGWTLPDYGEARILIKPDLRARRDLLERNQADDCYHIFSGFDMTPLNSQTLCTALKLPCKTGVYLEGPINYPAWKYLLKTIKYRFFAQKYSAVDLILPVGEMAAAYYRRCGFAADKIFPFAYFVNKSATSLKSKPNDTFRFLYVGQNIARKRIDLIIRALENLPGEWRFDCIGAGDEAYGQYDVPETIKSRVHFLGALPNDKTKEIMASSDALILPSRFDGWGAVVSEALLNGTKAIVSSQVGAKDLVRNVPWRGGVFQSGSVQALQQAMLEVMNDGTLDLQERQKIQGWADDIIAPVTGARYFLECLKYSASKDLTKPTTPWS